MGDLNELMERFLDDRESLDEQQLAELVAGVRESPEQLAELKDQLIVDEALSQKQGVDRANFPAQVAQRLRDNNREDELIRQVDEMRSLAVDEYDQQYHRRRRGWTRWLVAAALVLAALGGG